jgi:hypothetical protein
LKNAGKNVSLGRCKLRGKYEGGERKHGENLNEKNQERKKWGIAAERVNT